MTLNDGCLLLGSKVGLERGHISISHTFLLTSSAFNPWKAPTEEGQSGRNEVAEFIPQAS